MTFSDFGFDSRLLDGLDSMGFDKPTPIQEQAIPIILENRDLIACAQTGTGKTAAYVLPILDKVSQTDGKHINTLVLAPTRELVQQIDQQVEGFAYFLSVGSVPVYGGGDGAIFVQQKRAMQEGTDIVIATPGRLIAHLTSGNVKLDHVEHLVLDEADRMLDMGFYEDIIRIINYLPKKRQTLLFSATMPPKIRALAARILNEPEQVNIAISKPAAGVVQQAYLTHDNQKTPLLRKLLGTGEYKSVIIFASTKEKVKALDRELQRGKMAIKAFHSDLEQKEREEILRAFKNRDLQVLIGTDIISRGIDVDGIDLVINYDVPGDPEDYVHRVGRTARAESTGLAITFINERDQRRFHHIETLIGDEITKFSPPEELGEGPAYEPNKKRGEGRRPGGRRGAGSKGRPGNQKAGRKPRNNQK